MARRVSMRDVAALAGVSGQTVSRVVNGSPRVDPATRSRVEAAMAQLGYRLHHAARALRTGRSYTIGLIVSTLESVGNFRMLNAIAQAAVSEGFAVTVVTVTERAAVPVAFARLHELGVDGIIFLNEATALARGVELDDDLAVVVVDALLDESVDHVQTDHAAGARLSTAHLLAQGHQTVWHLAGPADSFAAAERERGWREVLAQAGRDVPQMLRGDWTSASGYAAACDLSSQATALFAANDEMALGALRAFSEQRRRVPDDIGIVGFDDLPDAGYYQPPLTTIRQDFTGLGAAAVASLLATIAGERPASVIIEPTLIVRESSARGR